MKLLLAHKFFHLVGGAEEYIRQQHRVMEAHGHEIAPFALRDARNPETPYDRYFLAPLDLRSAHWRYKLAHVPRILARTFYSFEARRRMAELVRDFRPEVAHLHAIENHISPSVLDELRGAGIPIVQSVNNYKQLCASYRLYLPDRQELCERCRAGRYYHALGTRCVKGSLAASLVGMLEMYLHQSVMKIYDKVDRFVVPNEFVGSRVVAAGHPAEKLVKLRNPFDLHATRECEGHDDFVLFFGRIEPEKGVMFLLQAMERLPNVRLIVVGDGLQREACERHAREHGQDNVEFTGPKWGEELSPYLERCRLVVVPSLWHEPSPYVVYQALATGKPVVGCRVGGIPDLLTPETGELVEAGDVEGLAQAIGSIAGDPARLREMGHAARRWAEEHLDPAIYYEGIMEVYGALCGRTLR